MAAQAVGETRRVVAVGVGEYHRELVTPDASGEVATAHGTSHREAELTEKVVAESVAEGVVHDLEAVEVGEHQRERPAVAGAAHGRGSVSYTHLRAHETGRNLVCRLL